MFVEIGLLSVIGCITYKLYYKEYLKFKKDFYNLIERIPALKNNQGEKVNLLKYDKTEYGYKIKLQLPVGISSEQFENQLLTLKQGLELTSTHLNIDNRLITLNGIKSYNFKQYEPVKLPPNKILVGEFIGERIIVDMNKFPHALICGDTGTGKSRILFTILTNLIYNAKANLYLLQVRKNDLVVFRNCKQVKSCSRTLEEVLEALRAVDKELLVRDNLLDIEKNYLNIEEYNKKSGQILKYTYVVIEEFSFLNISRADSKEEKQLKAECMKYIKNIVNAGRSSGIFLITSLQKPTADSIPADIKAMLTTRIALNIKDKSTCQVVMGDSSAVNLGERELVCRTKDTETGYSLTIDFDEIKEYTKNYQIEKQQKKSTPIKTNTQNTVVDILKALSL